MSRRSTDKRHFIIVGVLIVLTTVLMYWLLRSMLPLPIQAAAESIIVDQLIDWHLMVIAFLFALVVVFMGYALIVFRRRPGDNSEGEHFEGNTALEVTWTFVPLVAVLVFGFFFGIDSLRQVTHAEENELAVKVNAFQWSWSFEYPEGFNTAELVLPVDRRARMEMNSTDVIHSFWVPEFRVKQDVVPGAQMELRFTPIEVGEYKLMCAEMCGLTHWNMVVPVRVLEQADYDAWLQEQVAQAGSAVADAADDQAANP